MVKYWFILPVLFVCLLFTAPFTLAQGEAEKADGGEAARQKLLDSREEGASPLPDKNENVSNPEKIEVSADDALEWNRDNQQFIARGNARAVQGDVSVAGQTLTADYREAGGESFDIWRLTAAGDVVIESGGNVATGGRAVYRVDKGLAVMTGAPLLMEAPNQTLIAQESFEYQVREGHLIARGDAEFIRANDTIEADVLEAWFSEDNQGQRTLERAKAAGNVVITTPSEVITGDAGVYLRKAETIMLTGDVKVKRGKNTLEGARATVNLRTNISHIFAKPKGQADDEGGRVKGVFYPDTNEGGMENNADTQNGVE